MSVKKDAVRETVVPTTCVSPKKLNELLRKMNMTKYNVTFACNECSRFHPTNVWLSVNQYFPRNTKINAVYKGKSLPPEVMKLLRRPALCPITRNSVFLDYSEQLYVVAE